MPDRSTRPQTRYIRYVPTPANIRRIGKLHASLYRATFGIVGGKVDGLHICLLTTVGHRSGQKRTVPLPYFRDAGRLLLVGSFGGNASDPAWVRNLSAEPAVEVQVGFRRMQAHAALAQGEERYRLWQAITRDYPRYLAYQQRTARPIPVIVVSPTPESTGRPR